MALMVQFGEKKNAWEKFFFHEQIILSSFQNSVI